MADRDSTVFGELWEDDELVVCPRCQARRLTPAATGMEGYRVCLECGVVSLSDDRSTAGAD